MAEQEGPVDGAETTDATPGTDAAAEASEPSPDQTVSGDQEDGGDGDGADDDAGGDEASGDVGKGSGGDDDADDTDGASGSDSGSEGGDSDPAEAAGSSADPEVEGGLDVEAERGRLDEVEKQIEEGRRALADVEGDTEPEPDGQPIAEGEGAPNAPPG